MSAQPEIPIDPAGAARFAEFLTAHGAAAIVLVGHDGEPIAWRHPDARNWSGTARVRLGLMRALHACAELQHDSAPQPPEAA